MEIVDKVLKDINNTKEPKQRDVYYSEHTKKYYIVTFLGFNEKEGEGMYNLYNLKDACMVYFNNMSLSELKKNIIKSEYKLVNNPKFTIEGEID